MSNTFPPNNSENTGDMFAQLSQQDVEDFYLGYQYWNLQHQIEILQNHLNQTRRLMIENTERMQQVQPTAVELATLARLQSNGVSDVSLLDQMLERGELWLDRTMQRLDYLEQLDDFIRDDYTQWCKRALDGAYDWIDSVLDGEVLTTNSTETMQATTGAVREDAKQEALIEATEELFLQKISTEDELLMNETTTKRPSITAGDLREVTLPTEEMPVGVEDDTLSENAIDSMEEAQPAATAGERDDIYTDIETFATREDTPPTMDEAHPSVISQDTTHPDNGQVMQENMAPKRHSLMQRFLGKIWGS